MITKFYVNAWYHWQARGMKHCFKTLLHARWIPIFVQSFTSISQVFFGDTSPQCHPVSDSEPGWPRILKLSTEALVETELQQQQQKNF